MRKLKCKRWRVGIALWSFAVAMLGVVQSSATAQQFDPPQFDVSYAVIFDGIDAGMSRRSFRKDASGVVSVAHVLEVNSLLQMLGADPLRHIMAASILPDGRVMPQRFFYSDESEGKGLSEAIFDWESRQLIVEGGKYANSRVELPQADEVLDWESWYLSLLLRPVQSFAGQKVAIAEIDGIKKYTYGKVTAETLNTAVGAFEVHKLSMTRDDRKNRGFTVWLAPELANLPVKIQRKRKDRVSELNITQVDWIE